MDDLISRQAAIDAVKCGALSAAMVYGRTDEGSTALYETVKAIKALPPAQPERKRGKWIIGSLCSTGGAGGAYRVLRCSECDHQEPWPWLTSRNFCPNCGADMRGEEQDA